MEQISSSWKLFSSQLLSSYYSNLLFAVCYQRHHGRRHQPTTQRSEAITRFARRHRGEHQQKDKSHADFSVRFGSGIKAMKSPVQSCKSKGCSRCDSFPVYVAPMPPLSTYEEGRLPCWLNISHNSHAMQLYSLLLCSGLTLNYRKSQLKQNCSLESVFVRRVLSGLPELNRVRTSSSFRCNTLDYKFEMS